MGELYRYTATLNNTLLFASFWLLFVTSPGGFLVLSGYWSVCIYVCKREKKRYLPYHKDRKQEDVPRNLFSHVIQLPLTIDFFQRSTLFSALVIFHQNYTIGPNHCQYQCTQYHYSLLALSHSLN